MATAFHQDPALAAARPAEAAQSAVNWASVFAGAVVAVATTLILIAIGAGLGFAAASPWPGAGATVTTFAIGAGIWLIVTQWLSSALAGYMTGRLRTRWTGIHTHEVLFRDTAHGLLAWAVATAVVGAVAFAATSSATNAGATAASVAVSDATDKMLRTTRPNAPATAVVRTEMAHLLARGDLQTDDRTYLANEVAAQAGISVPEAQQRVDAAVTTIREAADKARKASSALGFFTALSMLIGAFIACCAAGYAGHLRDEHADLPERS
jgi:hypothetical protein